MITDPDMYVMIENNMKIGIATISHRHAVTNNPQADVVRPSGRGTVQSRPHKIFLHFHDLWTLLNKIREDVALSPLSVLHKTH